MEAVFDKKCWLRALCPTTTKDDLQPKYRPNKTISSFSKNKRYSNSKVNTKLWNKQYSKTKQTWFSIAKTKKISTISLSCLIKRFKTLWINLTPRDYNLKIWVITTNNYNTICLNLKIKMNNWISWFNKIENMPR